MTKTIRKPKMQVTTGWAAGRYVTFHGFAQGPHGIAVTHVGPSTSIFTGVPGDGDVLVKLNDEVLGCYYLNLSPMACRLVVVNAEPLPNDQALDNPDALDAIAKIDLAFPPNPKKDHKKAIAWITKAVRQHGTFAWWHFCHKSATIVVGVS